MRIAQTCKMCRRLGVSVCGREKCAIKRKPYPPGIHGKSFRRGGSEFGLQLREKQKMRASYNIRERQFKNVVLKSLHQKGLRAPDALLTNLEMRLDNVIYRFGLAATRPAARQLINHGHITINEKNVNIPSYQVRVNDVVGVRAQSGQKKIFNDLEIKLKKHTTPTWLAWDMQKKQGTISAFPDSQSLGDAGKGINMSAIIEYYSR